MKKISLQVKIGMLMAMAILLISATGYLSFRSLSAIVASIQVKSKPDLRLLTIRELSNDLEKAENSVRKFIHTRNQQDIAPYYSTITQFDDKINRIHIASSNDTLLLTQVDTISKLIEEEILIWNEMLALYHSDSLEIFIRELTAKLAVGTLSDKNADKSILRRVFSRKAESKVYQEEIIQDLTLIEKQDSIKNKRLQATESQLAITGNEIRERFYVLIAQMEKEVVDAINSNARAADILARKTYRWLAMFALLGTLLVVMVLAIVVRFVRKTHDYQIALIRSKDETEKLARTRELFVANMSHEIRTPVNAIYGFAEQLRDKSFDEKNRKILDIILSSADHLVKIVNDILDFSKLQSARIALEKTHFQISKIGDEVQLLFEKKALENNTRLLHSISKATPLVMLGDPYRLKQILFNLVGNAVKFTHDGEIHFSVDCESIRDKEFSLILTVADTGIGIGEDMLHNVFDDFTQAEADTTRKYGGTGLGLSIVKKLVELHQGKITLQSTKNKGTTVTCNLPYFIGNWELLPEQSLNIVVPDKCKNLKCLVVDDEEYNRLLFKTIFDKWNVAFDEAGDGLKAVELIKKAHYDLVFMDVRMPGLDGIKSTTLIRNELKIGPLELPVIGISATQTAADLQKYKLSGMNAFLPKPFTEKMLLEVILSTVEQSPEGAGSKNGNNPEKTKVPDPLVNLDNLYHLTNHDIPFVKQMVTKFIESTEEGLQEIHQAIVSNHVERASEAAHKIAAPCKHLGADGLYALLKAIENSLQSKLNREQLVRLSDEAILEFTAISVILHDHLMKMND